MSSLLECMSVHPILLAASIVSRSQIDQRFAADTVMRADGLFSVEFVKICVQRLGIMRPLGGGTQLYFFAVLVIFFRFRKSVAFENPPILGFSENSSSPLA